MAECKGYSGEVYGGRGFVAARCVVWTDSTDGGSFLTPAYAEYPHNIQIFIRGSLLNAFTR